jgi:hypothetical protein
MAAEGMIVILTHGGEIAKLAGARIVVVAVRVRKAGAFARRTGHRGDEQDQVFPVNIAVGIKIGGPVRNLWGQRIADTCPELLVEQCKVRQINGEGRVEVRGMRLYWRVAKAHESHQNHEHSSHK